MRFINCFLLLSVAWLLAGCGDEKTPVNQDDAPLPYQVTKDVVTPSPASRTTPGMVEVETSPSAENIFLPATATLNPKMSVLQVVYTIDGNLWLWTASNKQELASGGNIHQPKISPDGKLVAFLRKVDEFQTEIWVIGIKGEGEHVLVSLEDLNTIGGGVTDPNALAVIPYQYDWVPGTHTLAFNTQQVFQGPGLFLLDDFHLVDAESMQLTPLLLAGWGGMFNISPDGRLVVLTTPDSISSMDLDGNNYRELIPYEPVNTYSDYRFYAQPVWKTDSSGFWVAFPPVDPLADPVEITELWEISITNPGIRLAGTVPAVPFIESPVTYSPDANHLVYLKESGEPKEHMRDLVIANPDGSSAQVYTRDHLLQFIGWSINSRHFLYTVGENQEPWLGDLKAASISIAEANFPLAYLQWIDTDHFITARIMPKKINLYLGNMETPARLIAEGVDSPPAYDFFMGD